MKDGVAIILIPRVKTQSCTPVCLTLKTETASTAEELGIWSTSKGAVTHKREDFHRT